MMKGVSRLRGAREPRRWVGLDLGSRSIKLVELEQTPSGPRLIKTLIQELPVAQGGQSVDRVGWLESVLKEFTVRNVHLSVSGSCVAIRRLHLPLMSKRELPEAVKWELRDYIPFSVQEAVIDFEVIGEVWEKDVKKQDVLVAAASKALVEELIATVERAGARVASVSPTPLALWRCVMALIPDAAQGSVAVIELGALETKVTIAKDGHIRVVRDLAVGSASLTEALVGVVSAERGEVTIDQSKAEALKRRYGVLAEMTKGTTEEGVPLFHLGSLMRPVLEHLLTEVGRLFDFYKVRMEEGGVSRVLLCGAGATLKQLQSFLADGLGMTVEIFNPLIRMPERLQPLEAEQIADGGPRLAVAIGLALDHGSRLTLLPARARRSTIVAASPRMWLAAAKGVAGVALALYLGLQASAWLLGAQIRGQRAVWATLQPAYMECMGLASTASHLEGGMSAVQQFLDRQPVWEGIFKELSALVPQTVELDELRVETEAGDGPASSRIHMKGRIASGRNAGEGSLARFVDSLERSCFFRRAEQSSSELHAGETGTTSFTIESRLK